MKVYVNNKETNTKANNIADLALELNLPERGVALAVGTTMIQRSQWEETPVTEGADILIIKAACGG